MRTKPMRTLALVYLLLLSACDGAAPPAAPQAAGLRLDGLENARVGMTLKEAEAALGPLTVPSGVEPNA